MGAILIEEAAAVAQATTARLTYCIGCGCHDLEACVGPDGQPCSWLVKTAVKSRDWAAFNGVHKDSGRGVCSCCTEHLERWNAGDRSGPRSHTATSDALMKALYVLLRMIPGYCATAPAEPCTDAECDEAIRAAAVQIFGPDRNNWPAGVLAAARGEFE